MTNLTIQNDRIEIDNYHNISSRSTRIVTRGIEPLIRFNGIGLTNCSHFYYCHLKETFFSDNYIEIIKPRLKPHITWPVCVLSDISRLGRSQGQILAQMASFHLAAWFILTQIWRQEVNTKNSSLQYKWNDESSSHNHPDYYYLWLL
mgnify:CR=1 FL=1